MSDDLEFEEETEEMLSDEELVALREAPVDIIICNHLYHMLQLATIHLADTPPRLAEAQLLIDATGAVVEATGTRLGQPAELLREAMTQIRMAFVRASSGQNRRLRARQPRADRPGVDPERSHQRELSGSHRQ